jgi:hypothetical protein
MRGLGVAWAEQEGERDKNRCALQEDIFRGKRLTVHRTLILAAGLPMMRIGLAYDIGRFAFAFRLSSTMTVVRSNPAARTPRERG